MNGVPLPVRVRAGISPGEISRSLGQNFWLAQCNEVTNKELGVLLLAYR